MSLTVRPLTDTALRARGSGLEIVLIVTGTILLTRLATWLGARITGGLRDEGITWPANLDTAAQILIRPINPAGTGYRSSVPPSGNHRG